MRGEWSALIYAGSEDRNREFKTSFPWNRDTDGRTMAKVAKSILAMSNLRDGGHIVIGVEECANGGYGAAGVRPEHLRTYSHDLVADFVGKYAEPYARFGFEVVPDGGKQFVVLSVVGFDEVPVICRASYDAELDAGRVYVRPLSGRPRSEGVKSYADMRELMDLAAERRLRRYLEIMSVAESSAGRDHELFAMQLEDFES